MLGEELLDALREDRTVESGYGRFGSGSERGEVDISFHGLSASQSRGEMADTKPDSMVLEALAPLSWC